MAIERDINKKKKEREPAQKATPMKPYKAFGKKGLKSPTYGRRNPHKDHGDKKPSLKTKASIIKDKAKKGQGLAKGGAVKSIISRLLPKFTPTPKSGTISTINQAKKFVDIRSRVKKAGGYAMGGEASESVARSKILKDQRDRRRKRLLDSINRTPGGAGKPKIVPKKKPRKDTSKMTKKAKDALEFELFMKKLEFDRDSKGVKPKKK
jgi:hypothetical protein